MPEADLSRKRGPYAKSAQRSLDIIETATHVFSVNGYHGGSLRDISRQLGVSATSIMHHFGSKFELLQAVLDHADRSGDIDFESECRQRGVAPTVMRRVEANLERPHMLRLLAIMSAESSAPDHPAHDWFVRRYREKKDFLAGLIRFDQHRGRISADRNPDVLSAHLTGMWDGLQLQWLIDGTIDMPALMGQFLSAACPEAMPAASSIDPALALGDLRPPSDQHRPPL